MSTPTRHRSFLRRQDCRLDDLLEVLADRTDQVRYPLADRVVSEVLVYAAVTFHDADREQLMDELARALSDGPGIVVIEGAFDPSVVDRATVAFDAIIAAEKSAGAGGGDHFAKAGTNDRVWNALQKLAVADPDLFADYYSNDVLAICAQAWLGPNYQVTSQPNVVNPGGAGQTVHRDYHLGFMPPEQAERYPVHAHLLSPALTLQGAVAHCDMPVETGPTLYLPHSHKYLPGYLAYWLPEFQNDFVDNHIQLPLRKGDAVFFNPALFHAAGSNHTTDIRRMANLVQISSAFGRAMETVDRDLVARSVYPTLLARKASGADDRAVSNVIACAAEGYPFPTNLDRDHPAPEEMLTPAPAQLVATALTDDRTPDELADILSAAATRRTTT